MQNLFTCVAATLITTAAYGADEPGFTTVSIDAPHHGRSIEGAVWYPAEADGNLMQFGENGVFKGAAVQRDATITSGKYPVILLSHGLGGNLRALGGWLGAALAQHGAIVVAVNHPNSTVGDFDILKGLQHWTRVQDLVVALDFVEHDPRFATHIDTTHIYAAGFSYGGWTALSIGGITGNLKAYANHCDEVEDRSTHCRDISKAGVDLHDLDAPSWDKSYKDNRISGVAVIDPALLYGLSAENAKAVTANTLMIGLGSGESRLLATDFSDAGNGFASKVPAIKTLTIPLANHFAALMECKPNGAAILEEEHDDPVCTDAKGADRGAIHAQIIDSIVQAFNLK